MASKKELEALVVLAGKVHPSLRAAMRSANTDMGILQKTSAATGKVIRNAFSFAAKGVAVGAAGIGAALLYTAKEGLDLASNLAEVQNVVDVTFGKSAQQINDWSKTALQSYGLSELSAKKYSSTLGALMKSSGVSSESLLTMSENLTALSGDFASFYNLSADDAFEKIRAGISGETEPLKQLGINMNVANLQAFAMSKGIKTSYDKMDQASQTVLRYNYLLEKSADAQGDFERTQDSYANQLRLMKESFKQLSATVMNAALPAMTGLFKKVNQMISSFANSPEKIANLQKSIMGVLDKVIAFIPTAVTMAKNFGSAIVDVFNAAVQAFSYIRDNWSTIAPIIMGIVGAIATWKIAMGIIDTIKAFKLVLDGLKWAVDLVSLAKIKDAWATIYLSGLYAKDTIIRGANTVATWAMVAAGSAWNIAATIGAGLTWAFGAAMAFLMSPIGLVVLAVGALIGIFVLLYKNWDSVSAFLSKSWDTIKNAFATGINWIVDKLNWMIEKMNMIPGVSIPLIPKIDMSNVDAAAAASSRAPVKLQEYASGGFANRPSIFGEAGPEMAIPLKRTPRSLSLLNKTAQSLGVGGGSGGPVTINFSPIINGAVGNNIKEQISEAYDDFCAMMDKWQLQQARESF